MSPQAEARLRAVRDCGVVRGPVDDTGFNELMRSGFIFATPFSPRISDRVDFRLTPAGRLLSARLPSGMIFRSRYA